MIEHLTENVARARLALDEASLAHTEATEKLNALQQRIRDVEARRAAIRPGARPRDAARRGPRDSGAPSPPRDR